jgi:hypothetical protein
MAHYARGVALDPDYAEGHSNYGVALARQGKLGDTAEQYRLALAIRPSTTGHDNWGVVIAQQGDPKRSTLPLPRHPPDNANAQVIRARSCGSERRRSDRALSRGPALRPDNADASQLGRRAQAAGQTPEAIGTRRHRDRPRASRREPPGARAANYGRVAWRWGSP